MKIKIKKEYRALVPRPEKEQYQSLYNSIKEDGQHLPIIINKDGYILDGYTRFEICKKLKLEPISEVKKFEDVSDEKRFIIITNLSRRQLNLFQRGECLFEWWKEQKVLGFKTRGYNTWKTRRGVSYKPRIRLNLRLAKMLGTHHSTAGNIMILLLEADSRMLASLRKGTTTITTAYRKLRNKPPMGGRGDFLRMIKCLRCKSKIINAKESGCHVHAKMCCIGCGWGV